MDKPEQWAAELRETLKSLAASKQDYLMDLTIQRAFEERERALRGANKRLRDGYADAVSGYNYIIAEHGRLSGVGFDRVLDHYFEWVTMPEREGLQSGSHTLAALKDKP